MYVCACVQLWFGACVACLCDRMCLYMLVRDFVCLSMLVCADVFVLVHVCVCVCLSVCVHVCLRVSEGACVSFYTCLGMCIFLCLRVCVCVCVCVTKGSGAFTSLYI